MSRAELSATHTQTYTHTHTNTHKAAFRRIPHKLGYPSYASHNII